ncbi:adenylylsulfate kinase [Yersinia intermedia]|uniref:Adenylylsulfate kinase n=1 Tax=Yersinia intermedia TaxID=631 RepID=A0A0H5MFF9_YERIN|nr:AAA family ATPase [Yersinia intermedia]CRY55806.1 adenylylsulfate kinase [Yersinia intermedia]
MLIIFSGLPGSGKSAIARILAKQLGAVYLRIDTIEQAIRETENEDNDMGPTGYFVAYALARENLRIGLTVITDSVNPMQLTRDAYRDVALSGSTQFLEIEVICSDQTEHRSRVENRKTDIQGLDLPDWEAVINREYEQWDRDHLILDSSKLSVSQSVEKVIEAIRQAY